MKIGPFDKLRVTGFLFVSIIKRQFPFTFSFIDYEQKKTLP
jgi:hypothetical protein